MKNVFYLSLLFACFLFVYGCGEFEGTVTDGNGNPVEGVPITLYYNGSWEDNVDSSEDAKFTKTDENGHYELNPGNWDLNTFTNDPGYNSYRIIPDLPNRQFDPEYLEWDWGDDPTGCSIDLGGEFVVTVQCNMDSRKRFDFELQ